MPVISPLTLKTNNGDKRHNKNREMNNARHENDRLDGSSSFAKGDEPRRGSQSRIGVTEAAPSGNNDNRARDDYVPVVLPREHDQRNGSAGGTSEMPSSAEEYSSIFEFLRQHQRQNEIPANLLERLRENLISSALNNTSTRASSPSSPAIDSLNRSVHDQFTGNDSSWPSNRQDESAVLHGPAAILQRLLMDQMEERQNYQLTLLPFRRDSFHQGLVSQHQVDAQRSLTAVRPSRQPIEIPATRPREDTHATSTSRSSSHLSAGGSTRQQTKNPGMEEGEAQKQKKCAGVCSIPCRARGMPKEHNFRSASFQITDGMEHGEGLICSFEDCRNAGIKFRYCAECKDAIAQRNFRNGHHHTEIRNPALLRGIGRNGEPEPDDSPTSPSVAVWSGTNPGVVVPRKKQTHVRGAGAATAPSITTGRSSAVFSSASSSSGPQLLETLLLAVEPSGSLPYSMTHKKEPPGAGDAGEASSSSISPPAAGGATTINSRHGYAFQSSITSPGRRSVSALPGAGLGTHHAHPLPSSIHEHLLHRTTASSMPTSAGGAGGLLVSKMERDFSCQKFLSRRHVDGTAATTAAEKGVAAARSKCRAPTKKPCPARRKVADEVPTMERRRAWDRLLGKRPRGVEDSAEKMCEWIGSVFALSDMETPFSGSIYSSSSSSSSSSDASLNNKN